MASGGLYVGEFSLRNNPASNINTNIYASNGNSITAEMGVLSVADYNLNQCITSNQVGVNVKESVPIQLQSKVYAEPEPIPTDLTATAQGIAVSLDVSSLNKVSGYVNEALLFTANEIRTDAYISLGSVSKKQICLFGTVSSWEDVSNGETANLYIFYSNNDGSLIYQTSLGAISFTKVASPTTYQYNFSRDWCSSASRVYLMCDKTISIDLGYSVSS